MKLVIDISDEVMTIIKVNGHLSCDDIEEIRNAIEYGTPLPKGQWIMVDKDKLKCSECEVIHYIAQYPQSANISYCPNCGAKMEVKE